MTPRRLELDRDAPIFATRKSGEMTVSNKVFTCLQKGHQLRENTTTGADAIACSQNCAGEAFVAPPAK